MELKSKTTFRRDQKGGPFKSTQKTTIIKKKIQSVCTIISIILKRSIGQTKVREAKMSSITYEKNQNESLKTYYIICFF